MLETRTPTHICAYALAKLLEKCKQPHGLQRYLSTHCVTFVIEHYSLEWNLKRLDLLDGLVEFPRKPTTIRHVIGGAVAILKTAFQTFFNLPSRIYCNFDRPALLKRGDSFSGSFLLSSSPSSWWHMSTLLRSHSAQNSYKHLYLLTRLDNTSS